MKKGSTADSIIRDAFKRIEDNKKEYQKQVEENAKQKPLKVIILPND